MANPATTSAARASVHHQSKVEFKTKAARMLELRHPSRNVIDASAASVSLAIEEAVLRFKMDSENMAMAVTAR